MKQTDSTDSKTNLTVTVNGVSFKMVYVQGGTFTMGEIPDQVKDAESDSVSRMIRRTDGSPEEDFDSYPEATPAHRVTLSDYFIGRTEVTFEQFAVFIEATGYETDADKGGGTYVPLSDAEDVWGVVVGVTWLCKANGRPRGASELKHPVIHVSWNDAMAYCRWLSQQTGKHYTLPTEAQWEYAARGGNRASGTKYSGSRSIDKVAWYEDNSEAGTHPVGTKAPNELGLYDMSGNVVEWCADWLGDYSAYSQTNPQGPSSGFYRVSRGGGWDCDARSCEVSDRYGAVPDYRGNDCGFRLALLP